MTTIGHFNLLMLHSSESWALNNRIRVEVFAMVCLKKPLTESALNNLKNETQERFKRREIMEWVELKQ